jgi:heptosyltransferase-2
MSVTGRKYLIVGPSWVGDMVMAQSLFITLRQQYPDCSIDVVSPAWSLPVIERMPEVRQGIGLSVKHGEFSLGERIKLGRSLRNEQYTHAIVLPRSWKSALVPFAAKVPVRTGYKGEMRYGLINDMRTLDKATLTRTVQRYVAHAYEQNPVAPPDIPFPGLSTDQENTRQLLDKLGLDRRKPVIAMMPGAEYGPAKQWPIAYYAQLAEKLCANGYQLWVLGSEKERAAGDEIAAVGEDCYNLCGKTRLADVVDLIAATEQVVTNDSGLMHIAAATGVVVNAIYGSSTPDYTPPLTNKSKVFYKALDCSPCFDRQCKYGHYDCLKDIKPDEVYNGIVPGQSSA